MTKRPRRPCDPNRHIGLVRTVAWITLAGLLTACAAATAPDAGRAADTGRYPGPTYWDPARGVFIDPFSGHPMRGGGR